VLTHAPDVLTLAIDTCDSRGSVCLLGELGDAKTVVHDTGEDYSVWLLRAVEQVLSACRRNFSEVGLYAATAGPGSFTGIRVALTTVKAWNEVFGVPIAAVSRLEALARQASRVSTGAGLVVACVDAGRGQVYGGMFRREGESLTRIGDEAVFAAGELIEAAVAVAEAGGLGISWVALDPTALTGSAEWESRAQRSESVQQVSGILAPAVAKLARVMAAENRLTDALHLDANYIRRPDAEVKWKGYAKPVVSADWASIRWYWCELRCG
jgi:tRNA threonylcarbamoyl adenosine modification protein YeaZ